MTKTLAYYILYSSTDTVDIILKNRNPVLNNTKSKPHTFSDNLAFAYNDYLVKTELANDGESYGYITPDYSRFDYLMKDQYIDYDDVEYIGDVETDEDFGKRWDTEGSRCNSPTSASSESDDDGDWTTV